MANQHTATNSAALSGPLTLACAAEVSQWYDAFAPKLRAFLIGRGISDQDTDDVLQDVFVLVLRYAPKLMTLDSSHRRNYVYRIAKTTLVARHRTQLRRGEIEPTLTLGAFEEPDDFTTGAVTASQDWREQAREMEQTTAARLTFRAIWEQTPEQYRDLVVLLAEGWSRAEIATRLGITEHALSQRIFCMRRVLREVGRKIA